MQRCVHDIRCLLTTDGAADGGPRSLARHPPERHGDADVEYYADTADIPSDLGDPSDADRDVDDEDYRDELTLWAGKRGMVQAGTNYAAGIGDIADSVNLVNPVAFTDLGDPAGPDDAANAADPAGLADSGASRKDDAPPVFDDMEADPWS